MDNTFIEDIYNKIFENANEDDGISNITIYSDGACKGNPGKGGYGTIVEIVSNSDWKDYIINDPKLKIISVQSDGITKYLIKIISFAGYNLTTNNRMELMGVIKGFKIINKLRVGTVPVKVVSDSQYVCKAFNDRWIQNWQRNNWKNSSGEVKNKDLWKTLLEEMKPYTVTFNWVKGHASHPENNQCDMLAVNAAEGENLKDDIGYEENK